MNNTFSHFHQELQKDAELLPVTRLFQSIGRGLAKRKGAKDIYKKVSNEAKVLLKKDPTFNAKRFMKERSAQLERLGTEQAAALEKATLESGKGVKGKGFLAKHKGKLLLGGLAGGGLLYASSANDKDEEKRKRLAAMRNFNLPQNVYYQ